MSPINVNTVSIEEAAPIFNWLLSYAFHPTPPIQNEEEFKKRLQHTDGYSKYLVLYEDDTPASCGAASPMTQNVRGSLVDSAGVYAVATHPNYRRKGYSYVLLKELINGLYEEGIGFSTLYPFRERFYERIGYAIWPNTITVEFDAQALAPIIKHPFENELELLEFIPNIDLYHEFIQLYQQQSHGVATFKKPMPPKPEYHQAWMLVSRAKGKLDGLMLYTTTGEQITKFTFNIKRFYPLSESARYQFLQWIARHIDQTSTVRIALPPFEQPNTWFCDLKIKLDARPISPMGRVVDIQKLDGLLVGNGHFTARIVDPICPWNEGIWSFTNQDGELRVSRATQADCWLGIQGLSSLVFGGVTPQSLPFRDWGEFSPSVLEQILRLFRPQIPYLHEHF